MDFSEKTMDELEQRKSEIAAAVDTDGADLDALEKEIRAINAEIETRKTAEAKKAEIRSAVANGAGAVIEKFEEENKMENRTFTPDSAEYRSAWLRNLQGKELTVEERTLVNASAAIPTETMNAVVGRLELRPIIDAVDLTHIPGGVTFPVEGDCADAAWVAMGTAATEASDSFTACTLSAYKIIKTIEIGADVAAMAVADFENWLVERLANKLERCVAAGICTGTGSAQATGLSSLTASGTYTKAAMTYSDLMTIFAALGSEYAPYASIVCSRATFYGQILGMVDSNKKPIVVADPQAPCKFNVLGYPVIIEDGVGTDVYFGDFKTGYKFNFAKDVEVTADGSVGFKTGSVCYRAMALGDGKPTGKGIVRYTKATA